VGLAAAFGKAPGPPRSSLGNLRPVLLKEADGESSLVVKPTSDAIPLREQAGDRYRFDGEIARGGMGAVLRGRDVDLGRDRAVKVLLEKYVNRPDVARRFIEEAQIGGQLQHPGVVPVYDIGRFGDRPFFTMKLVKKQTLAAILGERTDPSADRPRLLNIALQVSRRSPLVAMERTNHILNPAGASACVHARSLSFAPLPRRLFLPWFREPSRRPVPSIPQCPRRAFSAPPFAKSSGAALFRYLLQCLPDRPASRGCRVLVA
jgi:hypothetical protein